MSLKCSVFGHRFADTDVTREREEQGSEVVITITETETCERCGETRVVSENKEVTTLETPSDIVGEGTDDGEGESGRPASADASGDTGSPVPEPVSGTEGAEFVEEAEEPAPDAGDGRPDSPGETTGTGTAAAGVGERAGDDGVILEEETDEPERAPGEWPQETDDDDDEWAPDTDPGELRAVEDEQPDVERTDEAVTVPEGEFRCPECGFTTAVESSSLREGDFCPECHRGSLTHGSGE